MNLIKELSILTTIPEGSLSKLLNKTELCLCDNIYEQYQSSNLISVDIGIGELSIGVIDDVIKYKFIPSIQFNNSVKETLKGTSPLKQEIDNKLKNKICNTYKDLF